MASDARDRITALYHAALARPPEERRAFLNDACHGDEALRREVESLLACESDAARFMEPHGAGDASLTGQQIGSYTILGRIDGGGMGDVYRARDSHLGRDVAIKVLPPHFMDDAERRARFEREARVLAALNHPHIGTIHGFEQSDRVSAIVMELVDGPTLAQRLERGPLPLAEVLAIARQTADALDAAHEKGIVHRDLKPSNIVLKRATGGLAGSPDDVRVKLIDFGLAKAMAPDGFVAHAGGTTEDGRILGTPAYMSPEQARGLPVDKRTDIWAFGCVLFEMLSGRRAFEGATVSDTIARVLDDEPDWTALPRTTTENVRRVLRRCLHKDFRHRLRDIADAILDIEDAAVAEADPSSSKNVRRRASRWSVGWIVATVLTVALAALWISTREMPRLADLPAQAEFAVELPGDWRGPGSFSVSPDGHHVAFLAARRGRSMIFVRSLDSLETRPLAGTEDAGTPFWKPDSKELGFLSRGQLKRISLTGGAPVAICGAFGGEGAWNTNDMIVFGGARGALSGSPLQVVPAGGGTPRPLTSLSGSEFGHGHPQFLPDNDHFLYLAQSSDSNELRVASLTSIADTISLGSFESHAEHSAGYLIFVRNGSLVAQPFDVAARRLNGSPVPIVPVVGIGFNRGLFSVSSSGTLAYRTSRTLRTLTWHDRQGKPLGTVGEPGSYANLDLSLDERQMVVSRSMQPPGARLTVDLWRIDVVSGAATRLTDSPGWKWDPAWSPKGDRIAFTESPRPAAPLHGLFVRDADASGTSIPLMTSGNVVAPDWSHSGLYIIYTEDSDDDADLWLRPMVGDPKPIAFLKTQANEYAGTFSPDDNWIAYESNASGRVEVYVRPFPRRPGQFLVSRSGGRSPRWRGDGKEIFFLALDGTLMAAAIDTSKGFEVGTPRVLFSTDLLGSGFRGYVVSKDGQRFLLPVPDRSSPIVVRLNWKASLATQNR